MTEEDEKQAMRRMGTYMTLPFVLAVPPIIGWLFGHFLDKSFGTSPFIGYFMLALGFGAGVVEFIRILKKFGGEDR